MRYLSVMLFLEFDLVDTDTDNSWRYTDKPIYWSIYRAQTTKAINSVHQRVLSVLVLNYLLPHTRFTENKNVVRNRYTNRTFEFKITFWNNIGGLFSIGCFRSHVKWWCIFNGLLVIIHNYSDFKVFYYKCFVHGMSFHYKYSKGI